MPGNTKLSNTVLKSVSMDEDNRVTQSYLLGQLSRSDEAPAGFGRDLLDFAFDRLHEAKELVGCRMVRLDCRDELMPYYTDYGFRFITKNEKNTLNQMMAFV